MPDAATADQLALQASLRDWAEQASPREAVRALEPGGRVPQSGSVQPSGGAGRADGPDAAAACARIWRDLAELGIFGIALPESVGGAGGTVADLTSALSQLASSLVPGPVLPTALAGLIAAPLAGEAAGQALLPALAAGEQPATVALEPGTLTGTWQADGSLLVTGDAGLVLGAGNSTALLAGASVAVAARRPTTAATVAGDANVVHGTDAAGGAGVLEIAAAAEAATADGAAVERPAAVGETSAVGGTSAAGEAGVAGGAGVDGPARAGGDLAEVWFWVPPGIPGVAVRGRAAADFSRALAEVRFDGVVIPPGQLLPGVCRARVWDLASVLFTAEAAAVARWCTATAAEYAGVREQFGRLIGSFQAVKHLCAGMLCRSELAAVVAWDAARAADHAPGELPIAAAAAAAVALDAALDNAKECVQVLGGIGFTWEHDAHLYLRRALALRQLMGGSARWRTRTARLALSGARRQLALTTGPEHRGPVAQAARAVGTEVAALPEPGRRAALAARGYVAPHWPPPYGIGASAGDVLVIDDELARSGLARPDLVIGGWAGQAIVTHGSEAQKERFLRPTLRGEITWCQLFSEPGAGSDLAALRTRAERAPGDAGWRLTGQKVWTSLAREADWAICLARTDPDAPKHRGLTFFLVDMRGAGIGIRPLRELTGRAMFNEVFLDGVLVPDDCVLGQPGEGWRITRTVLATERVAIAQGPAFGEDAEGLITAIRAAGPGQDPAVLEKAGGLIAHGLAGTLLDLRSALALVHGGNTDSRSAVRKLHGVAHRQAVAEAMLTLAGPAGAASDGPAAGAVHEFLLTRCLSIAGGTTQILLSVVAERILGLPREEAR